MTAKLEMLLLRTNREAADNKGLKEMSGDLVNRTVVLPIKCSGRLTVCASKSATS